MAETDNFEEQCEIARSVKVFTTVKQCMSYLDNAKEDLLIYKNRVYDASHNLKGICDLPKKK